MVTLQALQILLHARASNGSELTHAECFLVHVLESTEHPRPFSDNFAAGDEAADALRETLMQTFTRLER
jgi:hypothetical protein